MKKILIMAPRGKVEIISTFPFLHRLKEIYDELQIHIIVEGEYAKIYEFHDGNLHVHRFSLDKKNVFSVHHYVMNQHEIFNIDIFYDFLGTFLSSFLGFSFKAHESHGFINRYNKFLIKNRIEKKAKTTIDEHYFQFLEEKPNEYRDYKVRGDLLPSKFEDFFKALKNQDAFVFLFSNQLNHSLEDRNFWKDIVENINEESIVNWPHDCKEEWSVIRDNLDDNINFVDFKEDDIAFLPALILKSKIVISNLDWIISLSSYYGVQSIAISNDHQQIPSFNHFKVKPIIVEVKSGMAKRIILSKKSKVLQSNDECFDFISGCLSLKD